MSLSSPYNQYQKTAVETATQTRLVVMLYDGAIRFLNQAVPAMQAKDFEKQGCFIGKAQSIIAHLMNTLDHQAGGSVAEALEAVYIRMYDGLTEANLRDNIDKVHEVGGALRELREAWVEVDRQCQVNKAPATAHEMHTHDSPLRSLAA